MNWGKGIFIAMTLFIGFIVVLATIMMTSKIDLESDDYYKQEIAFEQQIQALENANKLEHKIDLIQKDEVIDFTIPVDLKAEDIQVEFQRPNDKNLDRVFKLTKGAQNGIPTSALIKGKYKVSISYLVEGNICLQQLDINL